MTLKEFFEKNNIQATPDQRSQIGLLFKSTLNDFKEYVIEDGFKVKDYKDSFLNKIEIQTIIINHLSKAV